MSSTILVFSPFSPWEINDTTYTRKKITTENWTPIRLFYYYLLQFLMTPSSLAGCLEPGTNLSHSALRSTSHQLSSGTGIGLYSGAYPKNQGYCNTGDATALYSRVSLTFNFWTAGVEIKCFHRYNVNTIYIPETESEQRTFLVGHCRDQISIYFRTLFRVQ